MKEHAMRPALSKPNADLPPITLRVADACRITGIGRSKFYELIKAGEIEVIKVGAITLVPMTSIDALIERGRAGAHERTKPLLTKAMHPFLANAILTASMAEMPEAVRRDLSSKDEGTRAKAEDSIVEKMIAALFDSYARLSVLDFESGQHGDGGSCGDQTWCRQSSHHFDAILGERRRTAMIINQK